MPGASVSPCLHGTPAKAGNAYFTIIKLCSGFYNSKKQNLFKKQIKSHSCFTKRKLKAGMRCEPCFLKCASVPKPHGKECLWHGAGISKQKALCHNGHRAGCITSSAAFRRRLLRLPKIRRRRSRSYRRRKARPVWGRWGTWPAQADDALRQPRPHGCCQTR